MSHIEVKKALSEFADKLAVEHLGPLWDDIGKMVTPQPTHGVIPYLWKWETIRNYLLEAGPLLALGRDSERRVIYLQNPSLLKDGKVGYATNTLYAGVQLLLPGEIAPSHRHSQAAIRFIIEGDGDAYTTVDGEKTYMSRGDLILTPPWTWHDHGHEGDAPVFWMDGLDVGLVKTLTGSFFEPYHDDKYPVSGPPDSSVARYASGVRAISERKRKGYPSPLINYKWASIEQALEGLSRLDPDPFDGFAVDYINPSTGGSADARLGTSMQKLPSGMHTEAHRHVHSVIYHVLEGTGNTVINGQKFEWARGDFFVVPPWSWHEHINTGDQAAYLFSLNDRPVMETLGLEKEEDLQENGGRQQVETIFVPTILEK
jgi:gentisate 1,2-dioxygenase